MADEATLARFLEIGLQPFETRAAALERHGVDWLHALIADICEVAPLGTSHPGEVAAWWGDLRANYTQWNQHLMVVSLNLHDEGQAEPISRFIDECPWRILAEVAIDLLHEAPGSR
ncbi:hypothetical protein [Piscinibacterium candidicorallinum]|uniref:CdiI immunity protein domain-containing protein n=1 Tax=Piscinibacterium candidicorallinum TaxID=1793872 RepID=A0ABV7H4Q4_9BURK